MECVCPVAGYCETLKRNQSERHHAICQGTVLTPEKCEAYRQNWLTMDPQSKPTPKNGPGTELSKLFDQLGIEANFGCKCPARIQQMDRWGVEGCKDHIQTIYGWMTEGQVKYGWSTTLMAAANAVTTGLVFELNPARPLYSLVDLAISRCHKLPG